MVKYVVDEPSLLLVLPDLLIRDRYQCVAVNAVYDDAVAVVHHPGLGQLLLVSHNLVAVVLEPVGIPYEAV